MNFNLGNSSGGIVVGIRLELWFFDNTCLCCFQQTRLLWVTIGSKGWWENLPTQLPNSRWLDGATLMRTQVQSSNQKLMNIKAQTKFWTASSQTRFPNYCTNANKAIQVNLNSLQCLCLLENFQCKYLTDIMSSCTINYTKRQEWRDRRLHFGLTSKLVSIG